MAGSQLKGALPIGRLRLGESLFWHPGEGAFYCTDIEAGEVIRWKPGAEHVRRWYVHSQAASCAPARDGGVILATTDHLCHLDTSDEQAVPMPLLAAPFTGDYRWNDGKADPLGAFMVGTLSGNRSRQRTLTGGFYRYVGGRLELLFDQVGVSNGPAWSPDGTRMYWSHTTDSTIYVFDRDVVTGALSNRRPLISFPQKQPGQPLHTYYGRNDGLNVDEEGRLWVAMYEGARVICVDPRGNLENSGRVVHEIPLDVQCPTCPAFGGPNRDMLYVATASEGRPEAELARQPDAGYVLQLGNVGVRGLPVNFVDLAA
jgi:sugar lactone lactonase YvrE